LDDGGDVPHGDPVIAVQVFGVGEPTVSDWSLYSNNIANCPAPHEVGSGVVKLPSPVNPVMAVAPLVLATPKVIAAIINKS